MVFNVLTLLSPHKPPEQFSHIFMYHKQGRADSKVKKVISYWISVKPSSICSFLYTVTVARAQATKHLCNKSELSSLREDLNERNNGRIIVPGRCGMLCEMTGEAGIAWGGTACRQIWSLGRRRGLQ